jgi:hypothetical protein
LTVVFSLVTASLRYEDGKTLKGIGTRASKSRLTGVAALFLEYLSSRSRTDQEEDKKELLGSLKFEGVSKRGVELTK